MLPEAPEQAEQGCWGELPLRSVRSQGLGRSCHWKQRRAPSGPICTLRNNDQGSPFVWTPHHFEARGRNGAFGNAYTFLKKQQGCSGLPPKGFTGSSAHSRSAGASRTDTTAREEQ